MKYWDYLKKNKVIILAAIVALMLVFYIAGLWMPNVNSVVEGRYLIAIIGIPAGIYLVGMAVSWYKTWRKR